MNFTMNRYTQKNIPTKRRSLLHESFVWLLLLIAINIFGNRAFGSSWNNILMDRVKANLCNDGQVDSQMRKKKLKTSCRCNGLSRVCLKIYKVKFFLESPRIQKRNLPFSHVSTYTNLQNTLQHAVLASAHCM